MARSPSHSTSTCLREIPVSSTVMSASLPRPMMVRDLVIGYRLPAMSSTGVHDTVPLTLADSSWTMPSVNEGSFVSLIEMPPANW